MNRERAKQLLPIIEAFANGEDIEFLRKQVGDTKWEPLEDFWSLTEATASSDNVEYRIKPKPREWWLDPNDYEIWDEQINPPVPDAIKVREVLE